MNVSLFHRCTLGLLVTVTLLSGPSRGEEAGPPKGFVSLFNGKDLQGWFGWGTQSPDDLQAMTPEQLAEWKKRSIEGPLEGKNVGKELKKHWVVESGELVNDGEGLYATTDQDYGDFELWVEYKTVPEADSGIYLRGCPQVQIWDSTQTDPRSVSIGKPLGSGGLWNNTAGTEGKDPLKKMDRPFGEWNELRITMIGQRVTVIFNGEKVVDSAVMENYFDTTRRSPVPDKGPIQLQTHGGEIRWRNLWIREIVAE